LQITFRGQVAVIIKQQQLSNGILQQLLKLDLPNTKRLSLKQKTASKLRSFP